MSPYGMLLLSQGMWLTNILGVCCPTNDASVFKSYETIPKPIAVCTLDGAIIYRNQLYKDTLDTTWNVFNDLGLVQTQPATVYLLQTIGKWHSKVRIRDVHMDIYARYLGGDQILFLLDDVSSYVVAQHQVTELLENHCDVIKSLYPRHIIDVITQRNFKTDRGLLNKLARKHERVTIMFADIVSFTDMCDVVDPEEVMHFLNVVFGEFDEVARIFDIYKVETAGDCYVAVSGMFQRTQSNLYEAHENTLDYDLAADKMVEFAKEVVRRVSLIMMPGLDTPVKLRIGINTGSVTSGIIDNIMPKFCLFGDTMNVASRMESTCPTLHIQISKRTYDVLCDKSGFKQRHVNIKGKGMMTTYVFDTTTLRDKDSEKVFKKHSSELCSPKEHPYKAFYLASKTIYHVEKINPTQGRIRHSLEIMGSHTEMLPPVRLTRGVSLPQIFEGI